MKIIVKEEERIVIAIMEGCEWDALDFMDKRLGSMGLCLMYGSPKLTAPVEMDDQYKGIARCHPNDEWDEEKGIEIAKARAIANHHRAMFRIVSSMAERIEELSTELDLDAYHVSWKSDNRLAELEGKEIVE